VCANLSELLVSESLERKKMKVLGAEYDVKMNSTFFLFFDKSRQKKENGKGGGT
jgi:hypothetical protein